MSSPTLAVLTSAPIANDLGPRDFAHSTALPTHREATTSTAVTLSSHATDIPSDVAQTLIARRAHEVISALQMTNMQHLATFVHPNRGLRFSPYAYVGMSDLVFPVEQLLLLPGNTTSYVWGSYDGVGKPIVLTFNAYFQRFIYTHDFAHAEQISYNRRIGQGNTSDNSATFYPHSIIVEYHFTGFEPKYSGMDWQSLRLVFQQDNQVWYLVGIIHDQWTI